MDEDEDVDYVLFQGALNGREANLGANARLAQAGLIPAKEIVTDVPSADARSAADRAQGGARARRSFRSTASPIAGSRLSKQQGHAVTQMMKLLSGLDMQLRQQAAIGRNPGRVAGDEI